MDTSVCGRAAVTVAAVAMLVGCGASQPVVRPVSAMMSPLSTARPFSPPRPASTATEPPQPLQSPRAPRELPVDPGAGRLPQTEKFPSTHDEAFRNAMADLWLAVTTGKPEYARPAFFPETAYEQVKAIPYPAQDWTGRLWLDFELDVGAAHDVVGKDARLLTTEMAPDSEAAWVLPGYCANRVGYWHINGARLVYRKDGQERSIGIASLISWRGVWYVVHFGAVIRPAVGIVNDPEIGPGVPGPAGGC
jgi:hypothetical protein